MKHQVLKSYVGFLVLVVSTSACSAPTQGSDSSNSNATQANSNSAGQPAGAQGEAPSGGSNATPLSVSPTQPVPAPNPPEKATVVPASTPTVNNARAPKLVAPAKKIDFGKQPQDKTLIRTILISNGGKENLTIESVTPS